MTLPQPKPEPGASVTVELLSLSLLSLESLELVSLSEGESAVGEAERRSAKETMEPFLEPFFGRAFVGLDPAGPVVAVAVDSEPGESRGPPCVDSEDGVARESWDRELAKCCSSLGRLSESFLTKDGR